MILLSGGARSAGTTSKTYPGNGSGKQIQNGMRKVVEQVYNGMDCSEVRTQTLEA